MDPTQRIRALRPPKPPVDPWRPIDVLVEDERQPSGERATFVTVFLAGAECPFTCVFCDLWRFTTDAPTPAGAIPAQLRRALEQVAARRDAIRGIKLYNASNFFDSRAVPADDDEEIARLLDPFDTVVVECHARLVGPRAFAFAERLRGRLQVAVGLETVHPEALSRLNKKTTVGDFDRAAAALRAHGLGLRAFALIGTPYVAPEESLTWTERSVAHALGQEAEHVALIPVRTGNGEMDRLERQGLFRPPTLEDVEEAFERSMTVAGEKRAGVVSLDLWDLERFAPCSACRSGRIARLERANLTGRLEPRPHCDCLC